MPLRLQVQMDGGAFWIPGIIDGRGQQCQDSQHPGWVSLLPPGLLRRLDHQPLCLDLEPRRALKHILPHFTIRLLWPHLSILGQGVRTGFAGEGFLSFYEIRSSSLN